MARNFLFGWTSGMHFSYHQNCSKFWCVELGKISYIEMPRSFIDENYLVFGHTLKHARDRSLIFFYPGYTNEIRLPNLDYYLYNCRSLTIELRPVEAA